MRAFTGSVNWISPVRGSFRRAAARRIERYSVAVTILVCWRTQRQQTYGRPLWLRLRLRLWLRCSSGCGLQLRLRLRLRLLRLRLDADVFRDLLYRLRAPHLGSAGCSLASWPFPCSSSCICLTF